MSKLEERQLVCAEVMVEGGHSVREMAREFGVDESTLRYRLERREKGAVDGRKDKDEACAQHHDRIVAWMEMQEDRASRGLRPDSVKVLYDELAGQHKYAGTYKSVLRYIRRRCKPPKLRPKRRVEVVPGSQVQIDWGKHPLRIDELGGRVLVSGFVMTLGHSRMWKVVWCRDETMMSWIWAHNEAFLALGGVALFGRIDNLKTGVSWGAGPWAQINSGYESYAKQMGFTANACRPRRGSDKGKVERRIRDVKDVLVAEEEAFADLASLQAVTDERTLERVKTLVCPVTGRSIHDSWQDEMRALRPLPPTLPTPFDTQVSRPVSDDCLVSFEGRQYQVPFVLMRRQVEVRGCVDTVEIFSEGRLVCTYPRGTACRLLIDQECYEGEGDDRVARPTPLGAVARKIVLARSWETNARSVEQYARMVESW